MKNDSNPKIAVFEEQLSITIRLRFSVIVSKNALMFSCILAGENQGECSVLEVLISQMLASVQSGGFIPRASSTQNKPPARCETRPLT